MKPAFELDGALKHVWDQLQSDFDLKSVREQVVWPANSNSKRALPTRKLRRVAMRVGGCCIPPPAVPLLTR
eukprot:7205044-Prymnesium_polylepis.1